MDGQQKGTLTVNDDVMNVIIFILLSCLHCFVDPNKKKKYKRIFLFSQASPKHSIVSSHCDGANRNVLSQTTITCERFDTLSPVESHQTVL